MKKIGFILKKAREEQGISIHQVHLALKIGSKTIQDIEEGILNDLPQKSFLRGFVQSYAKFLHLDIKETMDIYQSEMGSSHPFLVINSPAYEEENLDKDSDDLHLTNSENKELSWLLLGEWSLAVKTITITGILFVILAIWIVQKQIKKYSKDGHVDTVKVQKILSEQTKSEPFSIISPSATTETIAPVKKISKKVLSVQQEIILEALDNLTIRFSIGGQANKIIHLKADQFYTIRSKKEIRINFSDGGVVFVMHNGKDLGVPGQLGKSATKKYR